MNLTELIFTAAFLFGVGLFTGKFFKKLNPFLMPIGLVFGGVVLVVILQENSITYSVAFTLGFLTNFKNVAHLLRLPFDSLGIRAQLHRARAQARREGEEIREDLHNQRRAYEDDLHREKDNIEEELHRKKADAEDYVRQKAEELRRERDELRRQQEEFEREKGRTGTSGPQGSQKSSTRKPDNRSAEEVLGVQPGASKAEVTKAYKNLRSRYHPDKYAHMSEQFRNEAAEEFKAIQNAYERLKRG